MKLRIAAAYAFAGMTGLVVSASGASVPAFIVGAVVVSAIGPAIVLVRRSPSAR